LGFIALRPFIVHNYIHIIIFVKYKNKKALLFLRLTLSSSGPHVLNVPQGYTSGRRPLVFALCIKNSRGLKTSFRRKPESTTRSLLADSLTQILHLNVTGFGFPTQTRSFRPSGFKSLEFGFRHQLEFIAERSRSESSHKPTHEGLTAHLVALTIVYFLQKLPVPIPGLMSR
jgi:hypothetical protein